jgi:serine/threonine protein kinase
MNQFVNSMNDNINIPYSSFILQYKDFWIENDEEEQDYKVNKKIRNLYIVSEYASYGNLIDYLERLKLFSFNFTNQFYWDIIFEMMCGLLFIHKIGYIHLDIKPKNFLVNEYGKILLSDFCLTQPENNQNYSSDENEGDSIYLSPEFFNNKNITHKSDIYSLGLSILEILSQIKLPKNGNVWQRIRNYGIPDEFLNKIPEEFNHLIINMTNINPSNRREIEEIFNDNFNYPQLYQRFILLNNGNYERNFNPINWKEFQKKNSFDFTKVEVDNIHQRYVKRSDSWKFEHSYSFKFKKSDSSINNYT